MFDKKLSITKEVWWLVLVSGIVSTLFGLMALFWPKLTLATLVYMYGIFVVVIGAFSLFEALTSIKREPLWWLMTLFAIFNIVVGVFLLQNPLVTAAIFVVLLAVFIFVQSIIDLVVASYAGKGEGRWLWVITGLFGVAMGFVMLFYPLAASVAFVWVLGLYSLVHGIVAIAFTLQVKDAVKKLNK